MTVAERNFNGRVAWFFVSKSDILSHIYLKRLLLNPQLVLQGKYINVQVQVHKYLFVRKHKTNKIKQKQKQYEEKINSHTGGNEATIRSSKVKLTPLFTVSSFRPS